MTEIILTQDVPKLGYKGDTLTVRPGFARNYLIPQGLAMVATVSNKKMHAENMRQAAHKIQQAKSQAEALAGELGGLALRISAKAGASGRIFGSITTMQIAQALKDRGYDIDRRKIHLAEEIKNVGSYEATIDLHREVKAKVPVEVVGEE